MSCFSLDWPFVVIPLELNDGEMLPWVKVSKEWINSLCCTAAKGDS